MSKYIELNMMSNNYKVITYSDKINKNDKFVIFKIGFRMFKLYKKFEERVSKFKFYSNNKL